MCTIHMIFQFGITVANYLQQIGQNMELTQ